MHRALSNQAPAGWRSRTLHGRGPAPLRVAMPVLPGTSPVDAGKGNADLLRKLHNSLRAPAAHGEAAPTASGPAVLELPPTGSPLAGAGSAGTEQQAQAAASPGANNIVPAPSVIAAAAAAPSAPATPAVADGKAAVDAKVAAKEAAAKSKAEEDAEALLFRTADPWTRVKSVPLAGGRLDLITWKEGGRMLRVWTPSGFSLSDARRDPYPVMYLNDGQNLFDPRLSLSGSCWQAAEGAAELIESGALPPFVIVGIDHAGATRSYDYLPYPPGTGGGFRLDAETWPGGGVDEYLSDVVANVLPYAEKEYGVSPDPAMRGFGGSSFGGICALYMAMRHPGVFGSFLVESPSLWFGDKKMLREELPVFKGPWPARVFLAMGTKEYTGIHPKDPQPEFDASLVRYTRELAALLEDKGVAKGTRLQVSIDKGATHTESAWAQRLPSALQHLGLHWWRPLLARQAQRGALYFTVPRKPRAGEQAVLFFNQARSCVLADRPPGALQVSYGFNVDWSVAPGRAGFSPAPGIAALRAEVAAMEKQQRSSTPAVPSDSSGAPSTSSRSSNGPYGMAGDPTTPFDSAAAASWLCASITVPPEAYELHMAFADKSANLWDNNAGSNFYVRVRLDMTAAQKAHPVDQAVAEGAAWGDVQEIAHRRGASTFFTTPEVLVAGQPAALYVNRRRLQNGLSENPNVRVRLGFSGWSCGGQELHLKPTNLWRAEDLDWWSAHLTVPEDATDLAFVVTDGHGLWDNNYGSNYVSTVKPSPKTAPSGTPQVSPRQVESVESTPHAGGTLDIVTLSKRQGPKDARRANKWTEEKRVRVWMPPGFDAQNPPPGGYPVLWMNDGQNMFEDWLAHQGVSWRVGYTAAEVIASGDVPPFVVVAVDSAGPMRSLNYLPYPPGTGVGGFRGDAERWPGGGLEGYMTRLVEEIMPMVQQRYGVSSDPSRVAFGGGSFAGVAALYAAQHYPHVFGAVLAESPSLWIAEGRFLQDMRQHRGMLPERLFLGCGTREYSATRDHVRDDVDHLLLSYCREAAWILDSQGLRGERLQFQVEEGAGHHEGAWQWRLTGAMRFLLGPWWDV
ncbi:hypothetical protein HYH03_004860 [Edaphochlamys debaryana]|uniref:Carbohydrate binding module family 25 domain-containing protein n=1 Tax=Edaphochlamys debaryana TaxID=47281 RepID=A0A836C1T7_9CHLO|nr:hypothetical protein HYH03_004860 [Edaphochlamys debaryana]|eukprot:KAG2497276.1 hypothetical protein HYH03_004860 [Edaphochlamys debaryana]